MTGTFVRLKLRVMRNGFRGKPARIVMFCISIFLGLWFGGFGCLAMVSAFYPEYPELALIAPLGGALLILGWIFGPLVWFGVDETLNPSRFALLPLSRASLVRGLLAAALLGVPAIATAIAVSGLVIGAAIWHGAATAIVTLIGTLLGILTCVTLSRSATSAFSNLLGSRRVRDLAAICLALLAALLGPLQLFGISAAQHADYKQLEGFARVIGWTPLGAPWSAGLDASRRDWGFAVAKLVLAATFLVLLFLWWMATIETAMIGTVSSGSGRRATASIAQPVARLFGRLTWFPATRSGAMAVREARYWWRDTRRRASLLTFSVIGIFLPIVLNLGRTGFAFPDGATVGGGPLPSTLSLIGVGVLGGLGLANQFGFDGSAYAVHVITGVPGKVEMRSRVLGYSIYILPMLLVISVAVTLLTGALGELPMRLGILLGSFGVGLGVCLLVSVYGAYSLPETSNPFAVNTGAGLTKSLFALGALVAAVAFTTPLALGALLVPGLWMWLSLPVGLIYGTAAVWLGIVIGGDAIDRRGPELLAAIMPRD